MFAAVVFSLSKPIAIALVDPAQLNARAQKEKASLISQAGLYLIRRRPTLPHTFACSTIGPAGLNFRVRDGNGWNPRGVIAGNLLADFLRENFKELSDLKLEILKVQISNPGQCLTTEQIGDCKDRGAPVAVAVQLRAWFDRPLTTGNWQLVSAPGKFYGQAERAISTGKLHASRRFHLQPIKHVVCVCPS